LTAFMQEFSHLFALSNADLPHTVPFSPVSIPTTTDEPVFSRPFRETREQTAVLSTHVDAMLETNVIEEAASP